MNDITCRPATENDIEGILSLQERYLFANMTEADKVNGFVTTPFTVQQIKTLIDDSSAFVVTLPSDEVIGYTYAGTWDFFSQWAIFPYMVSRLPQLSYEGHQLTPQNTFQYGPICIDLAHRGNGIFQDLFETMRTAMSHRFPVGITFINKINERSYRAHTQKLEMSVIDEFGFNKNHYYGLAFLTK